MTELSESARHLLAYLVDRLETKPSSTAALVGYKEAHDDLGLRMAGGGWGSSLAAYGLTELADWTIRNGLPAITGLVVVKKMGHPGPGFFLQHDREAGDRAWWAAELERARAFDWSGHLWADAAALPPDPATPGQHNTLRTSDSDPLRIAELATPARGFIGLTFCPGKYDPHGMTGGWDRNLDKDLQAIVDWGGKVLVTLMESHELELLGVPDLGEIAHEHGLLWMHLPIPDASIPGPAWESAWTAEHGPRLRHMLCDGKDVVIHCKGGLGRTGLVAARLLIEFGERPGDALNRVRAVRPGAVETQEQERYVLGCRTAATWRC